MKAVLVAIVATATLSGATIASAGHGDHFDHLCAYQPMQSRISAAEVMTRAMQSGLQVLKVKSKHGCWEVEAIDNSRHHVKAVYDPTGQLLWLDD